MVAIFGKPRSFPLISGCLSRTRCEFLRVNWAGLGAISRILAGSQEGLEERHLELGMMVRGRFGRIDVDD